MILAHNWANRLMDPKMGTEGQAGACQNCKNIDRCILNVLRHRFLVALPGLFNLVCRFFCCCPWHATCSCAGHWNAQYPWNKHPTSSVPVLRFHTPSPLPPFFLSLWPRCLPSCSAHLARQKSKFNSPLKLIMQANLLLAAPLMFFVLLLGTQK